VVQLEQERDAVGVPAGGRAQRAERRGDRVAPALDGELDDSLGIEVVGVLRERRAGGVLDSLVDREDRHVSGASEATVIQDRLDRAHHGDRTVARRDDAVDVVRPRQVQTFTGDRGALV